MDERWVRVECVRTCSRHFLSHLPSLPSPLLGLYALILITWIGWFLEEEWREEGLHICV